MSLELYYRTIEENEDFTCVYLALGLTTSPECHIEVEILVRVLPLYCYTYGSAHTKVIRVALI
jgi:hypothetical protein